MSALPHRFGDPTALFPAVGGQASNEVGGVQSTAEDAAHRTKEEQLAVVGCRVAQGTTHLLHYLWIGGQTDTDREHRLSGRPLVCSSLSPSLLTHSFISG